MKRNNTRRLLTITWLVGCFFFFQNSSAQELSTVGFTVEDGLPSNETHDILQDPTGYMWICTDRGLSRYDGYSFQNYTTSNSRLTSNTIFKAFPYKDEEIWFATLDGSFTIYDIDGDSLRPFTKNKQHNQEWTYWSEKVVFHDSLVYLYPRSGRIGARIAIYHRANDSMSFVERADHYDQDANSLISPLIVNGVSKRKLYYSSTLKGDFGSIGLNVAEEPDRIRVITGTVTVGDATYFAAGNVVYRFSNKKLSTIFQTDSKIHLVTQLENGSIGALTRTGVFWKEKKRVFRQFSDYALSGHYIDFEGNIWYTTLNKGLLLVPQTHIKKQTSIYSKLPQGKIQMIKPFWDYLIISDYGGRLYSLDSMSSLKPIKFDSSKFRESPFPGLQLNTMHITNGKGYLPGTWVLAKEKDELKLSIDGLDGTFNFVIPVGADTQLYAGHSGGYALIPRHTLDTLTRVSRRYWDWHWNVINRTVISFATSAKFYWLGTEQGLWKIPKNNLDSAEQVFPDALNVRVNQIAVDGKNNVFIASMGKGLCLIHDDSLISFEEKDGAVSNLLNGLVIQNDSMVWAASTRGVSLILYNGAYGLRSKRNLSSSEGLQNRNISHIAIWRNKLWLGSSEGIYNMELKHIEKQASIPILHLKDCIHEDTSVLDSRYLQYNQNNLRFKFIGISQAKPSGAFYRFRLIHDNDTGVWKLTNLTQIDLAELRPGNYEFQVAARSKDFIWSKAKTHSFRIIPDVKQTLGFKLALVIMLLGAIILYYRRKTNAMAEETRKESKIKALELNSLINQMNPHFVFNSLNSLQNLIVEDDKKTSLSFIGNFSSLMRSSLHFSKKELIPLEDEIDFLVKYLNTELMRFPDRFEYHIDCPRELINQQIEIPPLLLQPLLENAVKHAFVDKQIKGKIAVQFSVHRQMLKIIISDNGIGIFSGPPKLKNGKVDSQGMSIVKERIDIMKDKFPAFPIDLHFTDLGQTKKRKRGTEIQVWLPLIE
jgi:ligand-binding sensor domain-containing protein